MAASSTAGKYLYETYLEAGVGVSFKGQGKVWNTAQDVAPVVNAINECRNMKYLELEGNTLGVDAAKAIGKALESHPELEIALWKDMFTTRLKTEIPQALDFLFAGIDLAGAHLQRLDLSDNAIGPMAMPGLTPFFRTPSSFYIEELIVNNEGLGAEGGSTFAAALMECLTLSESSERRLQLKVFQCGRNRQDNKGTMNWAKLLKAVGTLEEVHMPQNGINPVAIQALADAFRNNPNLRVINLEDNTVRHDGAEMLAEVLPSLVKLEELNLSDCLLKNKGAEHVGNAIRDLQQLRTVRLCANEMKAEAGIVLVSILRTLPSLNLVNLGGNEFGVVTCERIEHLLSNIPTVLVEDDEGDGGEDEEENDENKENEEQQEQEEVPEENPELPEDKLGSGSQSVLNPAPAVETPPTRPLNELQSEHLDAAAFMKNPYIETYMKLLPTPVPALTQYFRHQQEYQFHDLCIYAALSMSKVMGPETPANFNALLDEALKSTDANGFATSLCVCLEFLNPEKGEKPLICKPVTSTVKALTEFLQKGRVPVTVLECVCHFLSQGIEKDAYNILNSEYGNLIAAVQARLN